MNTIKHFENIGIVIIAAGDSSRLGQPKQLVQFRGESILVRTIEIARKLSDTFVCVLGYQADEIVSQLNISTSHLIVNNDWSQGMGSSIATGVDFLSTKKNIDAIMILLSDQYMITISELIELAEKWQSTNNNIIASQYFENKQMRFVEGAPAIFSRIYFEQLKKLTIKGARDIIKNNPQDLMSLQIDNASFDLDTKTDLQHLRNLNLDWEKTQ